MTLTVIDFECVPRSVDGEFEYAISMGRLSHDPKADNYAQRYMYMGGVGVCARFKHINTRKDL